MDSEICKIMKTKSSEASQTASFARTIKCNNESKGKIVKQIIEKLEISTFCVDCTPPIGHPIGFTPADSATDVRDPLFLRGFILDSGNERCLFASLDYCLLMNSAYDQLCEALGEAIDTTPDRVVIHCIHQHDTPAINLELDPILGMATFPEDTWCEIVRQCAKAAREAVANREPVAAVGHSEYRLDGYASNRRIMGPDGKVKGMRFSRCPDESLRNEPIGLIDPMLRTVAFKGENGDFLGSLNFYATHPQVANSRHLYSADAPGEAMRLVGKEYSKGLHAFCTGAGGNITAGKYSSVDDLEGNLLAFGRQIADGVTRNLKSIQWNPVDTMEWRTATFPFPAKPVSRPETEALVRKASVAGEGTSLVAAALLSSSEYPTNEEYTICLLKLGSTCILFCPGELFVEYQLFVQSVIPDQFVALAANCCNNFLYLPLAEQLRQGGYEVNSFCWCTEEFEPRFKKAIETLLT